MMEALAAGEEEKPLDKIRKRSMRLSDYNISRAKYNELKYFCMQYQEKRQELDSSYGLSSISSDGMPKGRTVGNPTERKAIQNAMIQKDVELIEQTAIEADEEIYQYLIKNVTEGIGYDYLDVPKCRADFYSSRKYFFYLLSLKR